MGKIIIAIDGHSSTGKSTVAKRLAETLDYLYVDTGAMYRAVTLFALENGLTDDSQQNFEGLKSQLKNLDVSFQRNPETGQFQIHLNNENVEDRIRTLDVSQQVSKIAAIPEVREKLVEQQQGMGEGKGMVMDGRDIGTVVFPRAELKLFMTASAEKRAQRRYKELLERGEGVTYDEVLKNVQERDYLDSTRETSPLRKAGDAIVFDNSDMGLDEQFERVLCLAQQVIEKGL
ncbi:(d)CMP kinase [Flavobacteriaceae bacterium GF1]